MEFVTSMRPSRRVKESPVEGSELTANSVPFTEATDVGVDIFVQYKNTSWNERYMCEEWLPNNLGKFLTCRILKGEHQKENSKDTNGIARGKHTLEQKMKLEHYKEIGIPLPLIVVN